MKKTLEMHGWKSRGPRLASLHGPADNIKDIQAWLGKNSQQQTFCRRRLLAEEAELQDSGTTDCSLESQRSKPCNHTFCFAFFCASHSFGKVSSDSPPRYDFVRFSPATLRSAPSAQDCGRVTESFEDHLAHEASISRG